MQTSNFRDNYPSDHPEHFFREAIFVPYLDHLIVEMEDRFFAQKQKCRRIDSLLRSTSAEVFGARYLSIAMLRQTLLKI